MSRSINRRATARAILAAIGGIGLMNSAVQGTDSVTIVPGSLTQGAVKSSLTGGSYANENANLGDWPLNTGGTASNTFPISFENADFNGSAFGGTPNTMIAFGNGGGVTLKFATPLTPAPGRKDLGIFTAQSITGGSGTLFNGNMEAAILVSADNQNWYTLSGQLIATPTTYTASASLLNAPSVAYNYGSLTTAWNFGAGTTAANLATLNIADFTRPMPDDSLFNGTGTNAQRLALTTDTAPADYTAIFGASGGGNWFDVSGSSLSQISYVRLNGDANDPAAGGVRLDAVFASAAAAVPEPAMISTLTVAGTILLRRRRRIAKPGT